MAVINFLKKYKKSIYIFSCVLLFLFTCISTIRSVRTHYKFISHPYQIEYREGGALNATQLFLENRNPFSITEQPQNTYVYGFLYPLAVKPFAKAFGNTLFVHRSFVYFFICATCMLVFYVLIRKKVNFVFSFAAMIILHQSIINAANTPLARPDGLGIFLFTLAIIIPWRWKFSNSSLAASIIISILGYLAKPYYFLAVPIIALYLFLFISRRKSVIYSVMSAIIFIAVITVTTLIFPMYINNTLIAHINDSAYIYNNVKDQIAEYTEINVYVLLILLLSVINISRNFLKKHYSETVAHIAEVIKSKYKTNSGWKFLKDEPKIVCGYDLLFAFSLLFVLILFIIKLGGHPGNYHAAYLFHLASPFLILVTFQLLNKTAGKLFNSLAALIIIITMNVEFESPRYEFERYANCFEQMDVLVKNSRNVLNSPENVSIMIRENKPVYNSGLSEYFSTRYAKTDVAIESSGLVNERTEKFHKELDDKIARKEFDLIFMTKNYYNYFVNEGLLKQNYVLKETICAPFIYHVLEVEAWIPKK